jgi:hypothetical protein
MKLLDLLLEYGTCDASNCATGSSLQDVPSVRETSIESDANNYVCTKRVDGVTKKQYCKKKTNSNPNPNPPVVTKECPNQEGYNNKEFGDWVWETKEGHDKNDKTTEVESILCGTKTKCNYGYGVGTGSCGKGFKAAWKKYREEYINFKNNPPAPITTTTTTTLKPVDPEIEELRLKFNSEWAPIIQSFEITPDQWKKLYVYTPEDNPPVTFTILNGVTKNILNLMDVLCRSEEFGLFNKMILKIVDLYKPAGEEEEETVDLNDVRTKLGGSIGEIKELSKLIENKNTELSSIYGFDFLTDPSENEKTFFMEELRTVFETKTYLLTGPLQMSVWKYTKEGKIKKLDVGSKLQILKTATDVNGCLKVLDTFNQIKTDPTLDSATKGKFINTIQDCFCKDFYKDIGVLTFKEKFDKEKREQAKLRIASLSNLGINKLKC